MTTITNRSLVDIDELYDVATQAESDLLYALRLRSGQIWECRKCGTPTARCDDRCDNCGKKRKD